MEEWLLSLSERLRAMFYLLYENGLAASEARRQVNNAMKIKGQFGAD